MCNAILDDIYLEVLWLSDDKSLEMTVAKHRFSNVGSYLQQKPPLQWQEDLRPLGLWDLNRVECRIQLLLSLKESFSDKLGTFGYQWAGR